MITVRKRKGEHFSALLYRFNKRVRQSGILLEAKKNRFFTRKENKNQRRKSALYRFRKQEELKKMRRYSRLPGRLQRR